MTTDPGVFCLTPFAIRHYIKLIEAANRHYIRFGDIPKGERSLNWIEGRHEKGVSVYAATWNQNRGMWSLETHRIADTMGCWRMFEPGSCLFIWSEAAGWQPLDRMASRCFAAWRSSENSGQMNSMRPAGCMTPTKIAVTHWTSTETNCSRPIRDGRNWKPGSPITLRRIPARHTAIPKFVTALPTRWGLKVMNRTISLSKGQTDEARRRHGIDLVIPWPDGVERPDLDEVRVTSAALVRACVSAIVLPDDLEVWRVREARLRQQGVGVEEERPVRHYLLVGVCPTRSQRMRSAPRPKRMWSQGAMIP